MTNYSYYTKRNVDKKEKLSGNIERNEIVKYTECMVGMPMG